MVLIKLIFTQSNNSLKLILCPLVSLMMSLCCPSLKILWHTMQVGVRACVHETGDNPANEKYENKNENAWCHG